MLSWRWFERPLPLAQVIVKVFHAYLKLMMSQAVQEVFDLQQPIE